MSDKTIISKSNELRGKRIEVVGLNKWVNKKKNVLQNISLVIDPREFVVVVGQSGGGKSSLVDALAGYRPATSGKVLVNGVNIYQHFDTIRDEIGYVPQRDIIHMELTPTEALDYAARLRMPKDVTIVQRAERVTEVLKDLDLLEQKDTPVHMLSGGQQKRVSIGVELLTRPRLFFLDEPTSGLDPANETLLMILMRKLADQGRTIILITHATKNVALADKVIFMARGGHLAWYGSPAEALKYFEKYRSNEDMERGPLEFDEIYAYLDDPAKGTPLEWDERFRNDPAYQKNIRGPLEAVGHVIDVVQPLLKHAVKTRKPPKRVGKRVSGLRQFFILSGRNIKILRRDRTSLILMLLAPLIVASMDYSSAFILGRNVFDYYEGDMYNAITSFFLSLMYGALIGAFSQNREIVKEIDIYRRERLVALRVLPYVSSKVWVAVLLALYQGMAFTFVHYTAYIMPGGLLELGLFYITMSLACFAGMMVGLMASAFSSNPNATPLLVIIMIVPQIVMAGAMLPVPRYVSAFSPLSWAYQTMIGVSGGGSDIAADACWRLEPVFRDSLSLKEKDTRECICMGTNVLHQDVCQFPGIGRYYDPAIDQSEPVEPQKIGDPPEEPVFPEEPFIPGNIENRKAILDFFNRLQDYQDEVDLIREAFTSELNAYKDEADVYEQDMEDYLDILAEWESGRNKAVGKAEGEIDFFHKNYYWTYVDKDDTQVYWSKTLLGWGMIFLISNVFIFIVLAVMSRRT